MKKQLGSSSFVFIMFFGIVAYIMLTAYEKIQFKETMANKFDPVKAEDLARMDSLAKVPLEVQPEGLYRHSWKPKKNDGICSSRWYFPAETDRLTISYSCEETVTNDVLEFNASMRYHFEGSVIRFDDVQGDLGLLQKEGYPFIMRSKDEFVVSEFSVEEGWKKYLFSEISF